MKKVLLISVVLVIIIAAVGCTSTPNQPTIISECDTTGLVNSDWTMQAGHWCYQPFNLESGDTIKVDLILREGDYAAQIFLADSLEYEHWANNETNFPVWSITHFVGTGNYYIKIPSDGKYYFVIYNNATFATVKVSVSLERIRWTITQY